MFVSGRVCVQVVVQVKVFFCNDQIATSHRLIVGFLLRNQRLVGFGAVKTYGGYPKYFAVPGRMTIQWITPNDMIKCTYLGVFPMVLWGSYHYCSYLTQPGLIC